MDNPLLEPHLIRRLRTVVDMTQGEFADAIGANVSQIKRWEAGKAKPSAKARRKMTAFAAERGVSIVPTPAAEVLS